MSEKTVGFWSEFDLAPKRAYRFVMDFSTLGKSNARFTVKKVTNPSVTMSETPHKFLNHTFYFPGRAEWETIDVTFVDPSKPDQSYQLYRALKGHGYVEPTTEEEAMKGLTKLAATTLGLGNVVIRQLGPHHGGAIGENVNTLTELKTISHWKLTNAFFTKISWGDFDYDADGLIELNATIRYDWAEYGLGEP